MLVNINHSIAAAVAAANGDDDDGDGGDGDGDGGGGDVVTGEFTPESMMMMKIEREKVRARTDPWKVQTVDST